MGYILLELCVFFLILPTFILYGQQSFNVVYARNKIFKDMAYSGLMAVFIEKST